MLRNLALLHIAKRSAPKNKAAEPTPEQERCMHPPASRSRRANQ